MRITNRFGLPASIEQAMKADKYSSGGADFSITALIKPPRIRILTKRFWDQIEEDVSERVYMLLGNATHYILGMGEHPNAFMEERLHAVMDGVKISGQADMLTGDTLDDYKVTSVWAVIKGVKTEWEEQLNGYNWLYSENGWKDIAKLRIIAILRDFSKMEALRSRDYPETPIVTIPVRLWPITDTTAWVRQRVKLHLNAEKLPNEGLPPCTPEEMWEKPTKFALMKEKRKSAIKLYDNLENIPPRQTDQYIQRRPGERTRCEYYCPCAPFCNVFKEYKNART